MSDNTGIEWTDATWNPVTGCTKVSAGCDNCYAETLAERFRGTSGHYFERGFDVQLRPEKLDQPLRWRKPRRIFVNSMSDLFHDSVPDEYIARVFAVMADAEKHTFQVLTKRHARMRALLSSEDFQERVLYHNCHIGAGWDGYETTTWRWPLPNVWLGVSAENQQWADIRIPALLDTPAAVRFVSAEPLLGPIKLRDEWLEWTNGCRTEQGERGLSGSRVGRTVNRPPGSSVASCRATGEPMDWGHCDNPLHSETGRESSGQVPAGSGDVRRQEDSCTFSPVGMASLQRTDTAGPDGEPQERATLGQSSLQPGIVDQYGTGSACAEGSAAGQLKSVRSSKPDGEADHGAGSGDLLTACGRRTPESSRSGVRRSGTDDLANRTGRPPLAWLIVGGESGRNARPMHPDWARGLRDQCQDAGAAFLFKQRGEWTWNEPGQFRLPSKPFTNRVAVMHGAGMTAMTKDNPFDPFERGHPHWTTRIERVGKLRAGRELDGRTWDEYPAVGS